VLSLVRGGLATATSDRNPPSASSQQRHLETLKGGISPSSHQRHFGTPWPKTVLYPSHQRQLKAFL